MTATHTCLDCLWQGTQDELLINWKGAEESCCPKCHSKKIEEMEKETLSLQQIEAVITWMETWNQLRGTVIPIRFKEYFTDATARSSTGRPIKYITNEIGLLIRARNEMKIQNLEKEITCDHTWNKHGLGYVCLRCEYYTGQDTDLNYLINSLTN
jgi:hypothetical protein